MAGLLPLRYALARVVVCQALAEVAPLAAACTDDLALGALSLSVGVEVAETSGEVYRSFFDDQRVIVNMKLYFGVHVPEQLALYLVRVCVRCVVWRKEQLSGRCTETLEHAPHALLVSFPSCREVSGEPQVGLARYFPESFDTAWNSRYVRIEVVLVDGVLGPAVKSDRVPVLHVVEHLVLLVHAPAVEMLVVVSLAKIHNCLLKPGNDAICDGVIPVSDERLGANLFHRRLQLLRLLEQSPRLEAHDRFKMMSI